MLRSVDKSLLLATIAKFVFVPRGRPWPLENLASDRPSSGNAEQDKAFIQYHYNMSNTFYALFLDPELVYSCAYFQQWTNDLATAQYAKLEMICRKLRLKAGDGRSTLGVDGGTGMPRRRALWRASPRHHALAAAIGLCDRESRAVALTRERSGSELKDHRSLQGYFDKIASIGMFEHVGIDHHAEYFHAIHRLLKPGGLYLHHAIVRPAKRSDREFRKKRPEYSVIIRHIFPGAELDHIGMSVANLERFGLELHDVEGWREHYPPATPARAGTMQIEWDTPIAMDDGIVLRADVFRPVGDGRHPVILSYGPYAKGLSFQEGYKGNWARLTKAAPEVLQGSSNRYQNWELVDPEKWVPDGYVCVRVDSRGAGRSPGYLDVWSPRETQDLYQCVEWAGRSRGATARSASTASPTTR